MGSSQFAMGATRDFFQTSGVGPTPSRSAVLKVLSQESFRAQNFCGTRLVCSWDAGWRSLLLRGYSGQPEAEEVTTLETPDHLIVLVTAGSCHIESHHAGRWHGASYRPGHLGMTAPEHASRLRWRSRTPHLTLHLHLSSGTLGAVAAELRPGASTSALLPNLLSQTDPVIASTMRALERALYSGAPDLYAETAAHFLSAHLLIHHNQMPEPREYSWRDPALRQVDSFLREHLSKPVSLGQLAHVAELGTFQLLRAAKTAWGETPLRRLTRLRMERAKGLLEQGQLPIIDVAHECGYSNPSHFATAFRRHVGVKPTEFRQKSGFAAISRSLRKSASDSV